MGVIFTRGQAPSWVFSSPAGPVPPRSRVRRVLRPGPIPLTRPGWLRPDLDIVVAIVLPPPARVRCSPLAPRQPPRLRDGAGTEPEESPDGQHGAEPRGRHGLGDPGGVDGRIAERRETVETSGHEN